MGYMNSRKIIQIGNSRAITIPAKTVMGLTSTLAISKLMLVDLEGKIEPEKLYDLLRELEKSEPMLLAKEAKA
jgi:antitoxin component of MazEF toxin-antitoxin module